MTGEKGFDVLDLDFGDHFVHVGVPLFDEREERTMGKGSVGSAEGEVVGDFGYCYDEVRRSLLRVHIPRRSLLLRK